MFKTIASMLVATVLLIAPAADAQVALKTDFGVGAGAFFAESEEQTFSRNALFGAFHWYGVSLPMEVGSGIGIEIGFPKEADAEGNQSVAYSLWNLNRRAVVGTVYAGADMKFGQSAGGEYKADFDTRLVVGASLGKVGSGNIAVEFYSLEENRPLAFSLLYRF
jgi:hypothetical protein